MGIADAVRAKVERHLATIRQRVFPEWEREFPCVVPVAPPLYHYTSAAGLLGILAEPSLWASAIGYSNDLREVKCAYEIARPVISELYRGKKSHQKQFVESLENFFADPERPERDAYVVSFCASGADLLHLWRAYGEQGGFSIEFHPLVGSGDGTDPVVLLRSGIGKKIILRKISYDQSKQEQEFRTGVERALRLLGSVIEGRDEGADVTEVVFRLFSDWLVEWIYSVKDVAFESEQEWRLICYPDVQMEVFGHYAYVHYNQIRSRMRGSQIVPYVALHPAGDNASLPIKGVTCGPCAHPELTLRAVELAVRSSGYDCPIHSSDVPLRTP
jgi:hypothetical protein